VRLVVALGHNVEPVGQLLVVELYCHY